MSKYWNPIDDSFPQANHRLSLAQPGRNRFSGFHATRTGGNYYGPVSHHGFGDKAITWGRIFSSAKAIATGASHSVAIRQDGTLWIWGSKAGLDPKRIMTGVDAVTAGSAFTIALGDGALWQWLPGDLPSKVMACTN